MFGGAITLQPPNLTTEVPADTITVLPLNPTGVNQIVQLNGPVPLTTTAGPIQGWNQQLQMTADASNPDFNGDTEAPPLDNFHDPVTPVTPRDEVT
jgi:hypothetical protein